MSALLRIAALGAMLAACNPTLSAQSSAPPGRAARLDSIDGFWGVKAYRLELSQGVAIAITCDRGGPCEHLQLHADDPAIADVRPGALDRLEPSGHLGNQAPAAALVVVGRSPGTTAIRVRARQGHRTIFVTVVPPPPRAATVAAGR